MGTVFDICVNHLYVFSFEKDIPSEFHDLDPLVGSWVEDPVFNDVMVFFGKVDFELWKTDQQEAS